MAGFTAERDMGTEGAGYASTAVRNAIDQGLIPGPRLRVSANAISILGGHEDAIRFNPAAHVPGNADYANNTDELIQVIRQQHKDGADFVKIYETGADSMRDGEFHTPYQYTEAQLKAAVDEAARLGTNVGVHAQGEPGTLYAAEAGVASMDHATQLSDQTMALMKQKHIPAVPTFTIFEYFADHAATPEAAAREHAMLDYKIAAFKRQIAAGIPFAVGSDVGPFPHGTQAREFELMVKYGMTPVQVLQADYLNGARILRWQDQIGRAQARFLRRHRRGAGQSAERHHRGRACRFRDEGRRGLPQIADQAINRPAAPPARPVMTEASVPTIRICAGTSFKLTDTAMASMAQTPPVMAPPPSAADQPAAASRA